VVRFGQCDLSLAAQEGEEAIAAAPALVELAAAVVTDIVFRYQLGPQTVMKCVGGRVSALCMAEVERSEALKKPHLALLQRRSQKMGGRG
jgi:hypothetical protein